MGPDQIGSRRLSSLSSVSRYVGRANLRKRLEPLEGAAGASHYEPGEVRFEVAEGPLIVRPPFGLSHTGDYPFVHAEPLLAELDTDRVVGAILVRLGGYAVGVFEGERLVASKVGTRYVQGRHRAGGSSANRFRRRREEQAKALIEEAAVVATRVLGPHVARLDALALGGDRAAIRGVMNESRELGALRAKALPRFFSVPQPRIWVLERLPYELYASEIDG